MKAKKTITVADLSIQVQELTVAEIRTALKLEETEGASDVVDMFLLEDIGLADLLSMTDLSREKLEAMTPTDLKKVAVACKEMNADFFALRRKVLRYADLLAAAENAGQSQPPGNG